MLLQLQLPGTKMNRHAIHTSVVYLRAYRRECVLKQCIVFPYVNDLMTDNISLEFGWHPVRLHPDFGLCGVIKTQSLRFKTTWVVVSFPAAKGNRWCRDKKAESIERIDEEGWMMLVIGAELTTMLWLKRRPFYVKLKRQMSALKTTNTDLFISFAEFGA